MKQPAKFSVVGVLLAVLAAFFYPKEGGTDGGGSAEPAPGGPGVQQPAGPADLPAPSPPGAPEAGAPVAGSKSPAAGAPRTESAPPSAPEPPVAQAQPKPEPEPSAPAPRAEQGKAKTEQGTPKNKDGLPPSTSKVGFTSRRSWESHFEKHGYEFGKIDADEYLARAKALRDAPLTADILEHRRAADGVYCRFHKPSGGFIAYHDDKTIRTFFRPNDGEAYYRRQLDRLPEGGR